MSKSVKRVRAALEAAGLEPNIKETGGSARTAAEAASEIGCEVDQIAKSIIFRRGSDGRAVLFLTAGGNLVDCAKASALTGADLGKADAELVRGQTGFAIGGVAPVGHLSPIDAWFDPRLAQFDVVWAAAGTPRHVFPISPPDLLRLTGAVEANFTG